jgi:AraC-like DNA-binding protein
VLSRWEAGCHQLCVKIDRVAFETAVSGFLGREITGILPFGSVLDISTGPGRSWAELAVLLNDLLHRPDSIVGEPLVARSLYASLLTGLIVASGIEHRVTGPRRPEPTGRPRTIDRAVAYLQEHAGEPIGVADVAAHCFVSVRTLQQGFERHLGQSPMQCLRAIRLRRAHEDLLAADPHENTVAAIAHRWGFTHLGRFAAAHEATFGEPPSRTLHRPG